jgi:purine nucleosidase
MRAFLIDTETASDDPVAILMALGAPDVRVLALTTVSGNVGLEQATRNALRAAEIVGADAPVYKCAAAPLARALETGAKADVLWTTDSAAFEAIVMRALAG